MLYRPELAQDASKGTTTMTALTIMKSNERSASDFPKGVCTPAAQILFLRAIASSSGWLATQRWVTAAQGVARTFVIKTWGIVRQSALLDFHDRLHRSDES
jgi:hypothetical protein